MVASGEVVGGGGDLACGFGAYVPALDPAYAEDAVDPVAGLCGDDGPQARNSAADGQRNAVADGNEAIGAV
jgi:hypothetical protein